MKDNMLKDEELEKTVGGETTFELNPDGYLKKCIEENLVAGAQHYTIYLMNNGKASAVKAILDSYPEHYNDAWEKAYIYYKALS